MSGTLNFAAGDTTKTFTVNLCKDGLVDTAPKVVGLVLSAPQPDDVAHLGPRAAVDLTINNVDAGGVLKWSAAGYSVNEGSSKVVLTVNRSGGSAGSVQVDYVIAGGSATAPPATGADFIDPAPAPPGPLRGTLAFGANVMSRTVEIFMVNDGAVEANESFTVTLQGAQGGASVGSPGVATVTIVDNDRLGTVQFSQPTASVQEDLASATLTVTRTGSTDGEASVGYQITGDTASVDQTVTPLSGTVTFPPGQGSRSLFIKLLPDTNVDGNSTLTVLLKTPPLTGGLALGTPNPATVTLVDDEGTVQFAGATFTASEGSGSATITLERTGGTTKPTTIHFATGAAGDTATAASTPGACSAGADYRPILDGALTFSPGQTSRTFTVSLCGDSVVETPSPETLTVRLVSVSAPATPGVQSTAVLQIQENDAEGAFRFSSPSYAVTEGASPATLTVLRANGSAGAVTVPWSITGSAIQGVDYSGPASGSLPFAPGQTSASLPIAILNDALVDGLRSVIVTLGTPSGGATLPSGMATLGSPSVATLGIGDNEPSVRFSTSTYVVNEGSTGVGVTVIRGGSTGSAVTVNVKTTSAGNAEGGSGPCGPGMDFTSATLPVTFNPGQASKTVTLPLCTGQHRRWHGDDRPRPRTRPRQPRRHPRNPEHRHGPARRERRRRHRPVRRCREQRERVSGHGQCSRHPDGRKCERGHRPLEGERRHRRPRCRPGARRRLHGGDERHADVRREADEPGDRHPGPEPPERPGFEVGRAPPRSRRRRRPARRPDRRDALDPRRRLTGGHIPRRPAIPVAPARCRGSVARSTPPAPGGAAPSC